MSQKDYKLEIIGLLLKEKRHIRSMAQELRTNQMMVARKVKDLIKANVVDFKLEGKNKVVFLKKTTEAKSYVFITESYFLIKTIKKYPQLRKIIDLIQKNKKIKTALLFGSYTKGLAKDNSDIDIYVDSDNIQLKKEISLIDSKLMVKIGKYNKNNNLIKEIDKNHVIIKGVENYYEKNKFFD